MILQITNISYSLCDTSLLKKLSNRQKYTQIYKLFNKIEKNDKTIVLAWILSYKDMYGNAMTNIEAKIAAALRIDNQSIYNTWTLTHKNIIKTRTVI